MLLRLQNAAASMTELVRQQERTANNLANANTVGFKQARTFTEALNEELDAEQAPRSDRLQTQWADLEQGVLEKTGNPLDVALDGEGFFALSDEETGAMRYTRAGRFQPDDQGMLRGPGGHLVEGQAGPIQLPPNASPIEISANGEIRANGQAVGQLRVVTFEDPLALTRLDGSTFDAGDQEPLDAAAPSVVQGHIETSNVDPLREMTEMITHLRLFESQQRAFRTTDEILGAATRDLARF